LHGSKKRTDPPSPERGLDHPVAIRHSETGHRIEDSTRRSSPGIERSIRKPDGQVTTLLEAGLVFRPIPKPVLRLRVTLKLDQEPCTNASAAKDWDTPSSHGLSRICKGLLQRQTNPHFSYDAKTRAFFLICARFSRTRCRPCPKSAFFLTMRENFPLFTLMAHYSDCLHD
jgi:hypothetical protein